MATGSRKVDATQLPNEVRDQRISYLDFEFLRGEPVVPTGNTALDAARAGKIKNHVVIRAKFAHATESGFKAAFISMDVVPDDTGSNEAVYAGSNASDNPMIDGKMWVKLVPYEDQSLNAIKTFPIPLRSNFRLRHLLDVAIDQNMHLFSFTIIYGIAYMGCRDFM